MDTGEEETPPPMIIGRIDEESPALMSAIDHNATQIDRARAYARKSAVPVILITEPVPSPMNS